MSQRVHTEGVPDPMAYDPNIVINMFERADIEILKARGGVSGFAEIFGTDLENGLSREEKNSDYESRKQKFGKNILPEPPRQTWCSMFLEAFQDLMLKILLGAAIVSFILAFVFPEKDPVTGKKSYEIYDTISIFVAVFIVASVRAQTNYAQQKSFLEINKLKNVFPINVIRAGEEFQIPNTELLVGDIIALKSGNRVAADAIYINGHNLKINNSQETGESVAIAIDEKYPFILGGGAVEIGDAHALICAVGEKSQSGVTMMKIQEIEQENEKSPLEKKLDKVAIMLTYVGLGGSVLTFGVLLVYWIIELVKSGWKDEMINTLVEHFMTGVTIFICAVPEGLPLAVTISLGFSMKKMMNDNNFVRHLNACETMGGATTICSDKTGTLTQNKMTVVKFFQIGKDPQGENPDMNSKILELFTEGVSTNTSAYADHSGATVKYIGPSSECALLQMLPHYNCNYKDIREKYPGIIIHPFNSERKRMSTIIRHKNQESGEEVLRCYTKGAPDFLIPKCSCYLTPECEVKPFTEQIKQQLITEIGLMADECLRTMLLCFHDLEGSEVKEEWKDPSTIENDLIIICLVGIADPLRPEVHQAVANCRHAGVIVRMVTGDYISTAKAIARQCGILDNDDIALEGKEFASKTKTELIEILPRFRVMARSSPQDKYRLVSLLMESGEVVAVTGDGSNDSPALKKADVGLSMGKCGTELAKMASDIVILDDNFNSIVNALKWGRCVYDNVRGFLQFQLTVNFAALIIAFVGSVALHSSPLKTVQLLWVNLIMDSLGALALATRGPSDALLNRSPYGESDGLVSNILMRNIVGHTIYQLGVLFLILFGYSKVLNITPYFKGYTTAQITTTMTSTYVSTFVFNTFVYCQVFNLINARVAGQDMSVFDGLFSNPYFISIFFVIAAAQALITEFAGSTFSVTPLNGYTWAWSIGLAVGELIVGFILRLIKLKDTTAEKLNALRAVKKQEIISRYAGKSFQEQWANDNPAAQAKGKEVAEKKADRIDIQA